MKIIILLRYNVILTDYADDRIRDKIEYIRRKFKNETACFHLENEITNVEFLFHEMQNITNHILMKMESSITMLWLMLAKVISCYTILTAIQ